MSHYILATHTNENSMMELTQPMINPYAKPIASKKRFPKTIPYHSIIPSDVAPTFSGKINFKIPPASGIIDGDYIILRLVLGPLANSLGANPGVNSTYEWRDGFALELLKRIRFLNYGNVVANLDKYMIRNYNERMNSEKKAFWLSQERVGAQGDLIDPTTNQECCIWIPNSFQDYNPLKNENLGDVVIECELESLSNMINVTFDGAGNPSSQILTLELGLVYILTSPQVKNEILRIKSGYDEYCDYMNVPLTAGGTQINVDLGAFNEVEYLQFYISDNTASGFVGIPVTSYVCNFNNRQYPDVELTPIMQRCINTNYLQRNMTQNFYVISFSTATSRDDTFDSSIEVSGTIVFRKLVTPRLIVTYPALANNSVLHIMAFGRALYTYDSGRLIVDRKI